jgi:polyferredoxin
MKIRNNKDNINKARDTGLAMVLLVLIIIYFGKYYNLIPLAIILLILSILWPKLFSPIAKVWFGLSNIIGTIMSKILLSVVFYIIVTPIGMMRRFFKADPLQLKDWKKGKGSVLKIRNQTIQAKDLEKPY